MKYLSFSAVILILLLASCNTTGSKPEPLTVNLNSPKIELGTIEAQLDKFFNMGGIDKNEFTVDYYPLEDAVGLQYRNDFITYHLFWSRGAREVFLNGFEQYKQDFEQRSLSTRSSRTAAKKYGKTEVFLIWYTTRVSVRARGNPEVEIGYKFRNVPGSDGRRGKAAFFTIHQRQAYYEDPITRENNRTSPNVMIFFTRAQAEDLAEIFNPRFIQSLSLSAASDSAGDSREDARFDVY